MPILHLLQRTSLPDKLTEFATGVRGRLSPEQDLDEEADYEECSDLLSASQHRVERQTKRDVVLGIETFTALQSKVDRTASEQEETPAHCDIAKSPA